MVRPLETDYLTPGPAFWASLAAAVLVLVVLVLVPLVQSARAGRWGWTVGVLLLGPLGGLLWFAFGRHAHRLPRTT